MKQTSTNQFPYIRNLDSSASVAQYNNLQVEPLMDKNATTLRSQPQKVTYGCCSELCSAASFAWWLVAGKVYKK